MKILSTLALVVFAFTANAQSYKITGKAGEDSNGKTAYLIDQNTANAFDSCVVKRERNEKSRFIQYRIFVYHYFGG